MEERVLTSQKNQILGTLVTLNDNLDQVGKRKKI